MLYIFRISKSIMGDWMRFKIRAVISMLVGTFGRLIRALFYNASPHPEGNQNEIVQAGPLASQSVVPFVSNTIVTVCTN